MQAPLCPCVWFHPDLITACKELWTLPSLDPIQSQPKLTHHASTISSPSMTQEVSFSSSFSLRRQHYALVPTTPNILECLAEVLLAALDRGRLLLVSGDVGVDELDESVEVLGCYLVGTVNTARKRKNGAGAALELRGKYSPTRSPGQSSRRIDPESRQTARSRWPSPCTSRLPEGLAADTLRRAFHLGRARRQISNGSQAREEE